VIIFTLQGGNYPAYNAQDLDRYNLAPPGTALVGT
jgi:hypothetical protein